MKLYLSTGSCSLSVHIALCESGLAFSTEKVNLKVSPHLTESGAQFTSINPKGYVPALELDNGDILTEGPAIVQYIADLVPEKHLAPANGSMARYRLQEWLNFIATEIHKSFAPLWNPASSDEMKQAATTRIHSRLDWLAGELADRPYLMGEFTVADGYLFTCLNWMNYLKMPVENWPAVKSYLDRVAAREGVARAMKAEGLA
ncbi:glutathione transferase GstA [Paludibacterium paludis]|uniref:Glutathione S-transferase n=1 Tax=Paludibacterium paludis TaxID=1225769 RepID=A0A918P2L3_9NEIS|nr:glutathione transferase GstA [Paludibacterium paludis]GGY12497.1 glutathione S-transferase [Paludibacterium paludis]